MMRRNLVQSMRWKDGLALLAGAVFTLGLSPFDLWPFAVISPALLFFVVRDCSVSRSVLRFYLFNVGLFGAGVSWLFVSIDVFGGASVALASLLVAAFVISYSLVSVPLAYLFSRWFRSSEFACFLAFCSLWVIQEWIRSWFLTGFPWMFLGYGLMGTWLESLAPLLGVFGVSLAAVIVATSVTQALVFRQWTLMAPAIAMVLLGGLANQWSFTEPTRVRSVSLVQGNIDQHIKWRPENRGPIMKRYADATVDEWGRDLIVWPEAAITALPQQVKGYLEDLGDLARQRGSTLILGIPDRNDEGGFVNTVIALGEQEGRYVKRRLVPFGEYVPLESLLRGVIAVFDLPMSSNHPGAEDQSPLSLGDDLISVSICYEVVYPDLVRTSVVSPGLLLTVSNDSWFGTSIGPWQHLQMARMRALENGRYMVRATNNGVTAIIDHRGIIRAALPQFETGVLRGDVEIRKGVTPFHRFGSYPVLLFCLLMLGLAWQRREPAA